MRLSVTTFLILAAGAGTASQAISAPITDQERNAILDKDLASHLQVVNFDDYDGAGKWCEEARKIAAPFDPDDWAQGRIDGCFAFIAESQHDDAKACKLRDSQVAHYKRVLATGSDELKGVVRHSLPDVRKSRAALRCK